MYASTSSLLSANIHFYLNILRQFKPICLESNHSQTLLIIVKYRKSKTKPIPQFISYRLYRAIEIVQYSI